MEIHEEFTEWAVENGVKINGVAAHKFSWRGLGVIATKRHEPNSTLVTVPISALRTVHTVSKTLSQAIGSITVHGLLAADLCLTENPHLAPWKAVLPTWDDYLHSIPFLYAPALQALLPPATAALVEKQKRKLLIDWTAVSSAFPDLEYNTYLHAWLIINTRTFYFVSPTSQNAPPNRDDCLALSPFADYFNHTSFPNPSAPASSEAGPQPCKISFTPAGYDIRSSVSIKKGDEIYISYGNHSNDFLLAEYGFILPDSNNSWDEIPLDACILPLFSTAQKSALDATGFLGKYTLDAFQICYRTQIALLILLLPVGRWQRIADGFEDGEIYQAEAEAILLKALKSYQKDVKRSLEQAGALKEGLADQKNMLKRRWEQIDVLLQSAIDRTQS